MHTLEVQRPQKMVRICFEDRDALICIRPCLGGIWVAFGGSNYVGHMLGHCSPVST